MPAHPLAPNRTPRPRMSPDLLAQLANHLTARDRWLLHLLWEHRVLTTPQITQLAFPSERAARHRLLALYRLRAIDRFRPLLPSGTAPWHYVLGEAGAHVLAAHQGITITEFGYRRDAVLTIAHSMQLTHTVGVNDIFARLSAATHRGDDGGARLTWWTQRRCTHTWGDIVRPDAYGIWHTHEKRVEFFLEYDTGTEPIAKVAGKLDAYARLAEASGITTPVLFWLPSPTRELNLRRRLSHLPVPAATASETGGILGAADPAGPVWLPLGHDEPRRRLADLGGTWPSSHPPETPDTDPR